MKILVVDLLYVENGSLGDDSRAVIKFLSEHQCSYLKLKNGEDFKNLINLYIKASFSKYDHIVILSAKINQLLLLIPLTFYNKVGFIYHFTPLHRIIFHKYSLKILKFFFKIGTYSQGVRDSIQSFLGCDVTLLPSREINTFKSVELLKEKLSCRNISILIPGVRPGVRNFPDLNEIILSIERRTNFIIDEILVQASKGPYSIHGVKITYFDSMSDEGYKNLYLKSLIVVVDFNIDYEVRASGILLDAMQYGCIVISNNHKISRQYGFPNGFLVSKENIKIDAAASLKIYDYWSPEEAKISWNNFVL